MRTIYTRSVSLLFFLLLALGFVSVSIAGPTTPYDAKLSKENADIFRKAGSIGNCTEGQADLRLDVNNVRARILNIGGLFWNGDPHVYEVPIDTGNMAVFAGGVWIGGEVNGQLRVAAARYGAWEFWPGPLDANGNPPGQSPALLGDCSAYDRIYKVTKEDLKALDLTGAVSKDIADWPYELGAPVKDGDGDPTNYNIGGGDRPDMTGDQMLWWVMNDMGNTHGASGTQNIGLEAQVSAFAFNQAGDLGNMTFYAYKLIYKGDEPLQNTYMAIWSDPDLGDAGDDLIGSDPELGLGFVYNYDDFDGSYGDRPPALGYDFFKGPLTDADGDGTLERLGMTGFMYFINGGNTLINDPGNGEAYYYNMSCRLKNGNPLTVGGDGTSGTEPTCFAFPGDPVTGIGWSEENADGAGAQNAGGDRRFVMSTGPFTLNPGETQEIVYGVVFAQGTDRLDSVARMKAADINAQNLFDLDFQAPDAPERPIVSVKSNDGEAYLTWGNNPGDNNYLNTYRDETYDYDLEGYIVYRYKSAEDPDPSIVAIYDKVNGIKQIYSPSSENPLETTLEVDGRDIGLQNFHRIGNLTNAQTYYFGIQAYAYSATVFGFRSVLYSPIARVEYIPSNASLENGGTTFVAEFGQELRSVSVGSGTDGFATATVVNPLAVNGNEYNVVFRSVEYDTGAPNKAADFNEVDRDETKADNNKAIVNVIVYDIVDVTEGVVEFNGEDYLNRTGEAPPQSSTTPIAVPKVIDGLSFVVYGAPFNWKDFQTVSNAAGPLATPMGAAPDYNGFPGLGRPSAGQQVNGSLWMIHTWSADGRNCYDAESGSGCFIPRSMRNGWDDIVPFDFEWRFEGNANEAGYHRFAGWGRLDSPFELWRVGVGTYDDASDDVRMIPGNFDINGDGVWGIMPIDHVGSGAENDPSTDATYWILPTDETPGEAGFNAFQTQLDGVGCGSQDCDGLLGHETIARLVLFNWNGGDVNDPTFPANVNATLPEAGTTFRMVSTKPNVPGAIHSITTAEIAPLTGVNPQSAIDAIGIVPNPYRGSSWYETTNVADEVRFTNLPTQATLRVFTVDGTLVRTLFKNSPNPTVKWDMANEDGLRLASGIYLIHVELADGNEKVLKFAMVRDKVQLSNF